MPRWLESTRQSWLLSTNFPAKRGAVRVLAWCAESEFDRGISLGERHLPILRSFPLTHVHHHPRAVDVRHLQV